MSCLIFSVLLVRPINEVERTYRADLFATLYHLELRHGVKSRPTDRLMREGAHSQGHTPRIRITQTYACYPPPRRIPRLSAWRAYLAAACREEGPTDPSILIESAKRVVDCKEAFIELNELRLWPLGLRKALAAHGGLEPCARAWELSECQCVKYAGATERV